MFGVGTAAAISSGDIYNLVRNLIFFVILAIAATPLPKKLYRRLTEKLTAARIVASAGGIVMLLVCMAYLVDSSFNPFLYFRF